MLEIIKQYLITISVYSVSYCLYSAIQVSRRNRVFPSLHDLMDYIRDQKYGPNGFKDIFVYISLAYGCFAIWYGIITSYIGGK